MLFPKLLSRGLLLSFFLFATTLSALAQSPGASCPCGNNQKNGEGDCPSCGVNRFDPYTGNVSRDVRDLEVWGSVGEIPLILTRYGNSRDVVRPWQLSFHYLLFDAGTTTLGEPQLELRYPQGGSDLFTQTPSDLHLWLPTAGVNKRIYQYGNDFFLQLANGHRYHFEKVATGSNVEYILRSFKDQYQNEYTVSYDNANLKKRIIEPAGRYIELTYSSTDFTRNPLSATTSDGRGVQYVYDVVNDGIKDHVRLRTANYGDGTQAQYEYTQQAPGLPFVLSHAIDPRVEGVATNMKYLYASLGAIAGHVYQELNGVTNEVMVTLDASSENRKVLYANGRVQVINMPDYQMGAINRYTDGVGAVTTYVYDDGGLGYLKTITDPLGRVTTYNAVTQYDNPLEITRPDGSKERWVRDTLDLVLKYTDQLGRVTTYTRDSRHRPIRIDYPDGSFEAFTYNNFSEVLDHQKKNGCTEHFAYDSRGLKTSFTDCDGKTTSYSYDGADRLAMVTDARGNSTRYEYNERGLLTKMINPDNSTQLYVYDAFGNRLTMTNELGNTWAATYDEFKRPKAKTDPLSRTTTYIYDLPGGVCGCSHEKNTPTKITLPSGRMTVMTYDVEWRKTSETAGVGTPDAATTFYEYDLVGNRVKTIDGRGKAWVTTYDLMNRQKAVTDPLGNTTEWSYDFVGNKLTVKRPDNGLSSNVYDKMNRMIQTTDPKAQVTKMQYDADGNLVKLLDPKNNAYIFVYDVLDRKTKLIYPDGTSEQFAYDPVNNLKTYKNRNGDVRTYTYDSRNRETLGDWSDVTPDVATTYDAANRVLSKTSSVSALSYNYNSANELLSETQNVAGNPAKVITYTYNVDGLRNSATYPGGTMLIYGYTGRNQPAVITQGSSMLVQYVYDAAGNRVQRNFDNGTVALYGYDDANRLLVLDNKKGTASFAKYNYGYDNMSRRTFVQYNNANGDVYSYDAVDQVTAVGYNVTNPDGVPGAPARLVSYGLDAAGNRTSVTDNGVPVNYTTNNLNEYGTVGINAALYTANGNLQTLDGWTYTYDAQDRLTKAQKGGTTVDFLYDAMNRCVKRTINGATTFFYFDAWNMIEERSAVDALLQRYVHGATPDEVLQKTSAANTVYYHQDALGSVVQLTDNSGNVVEQYSYDVFGVPTIRTGSGTVVPSTAFTNRFLFTGREYIQEIDLYDYRTRMYSPSLGRFLQVDQLRFGAGDVNLYRYVANSPVNETDPLGAGEKVGDWTFRDAAWNESITDFGTEGPVVKKRYPNKCCECTSTAKQAWVTYTSAWGWGFNGTWVCASVVEDCVGKGCETTHYEKKACSWKSGSKISISDALTLIGTIASIASLF